MLFRRNQPEQQNFVLPKMGKRILRFEVFRKVTVKNDVFWDVTPFGSSKNRRFGGTTASVIRKTRIGEIRPTITVTSNPLTL
jgi:hypothetical protein